MSSEGGDFALIAWTLRGLLAASVALGIWGLARRRGGPLLLGSLLSLATVTQTFLMRYLLIIPMVELALAVAYLAKARREVVLGACGAAILLYAVQLSPLLGW